MMALKPLIAICGTTGVGKSKLAVELALRLSQDNPSREWKGAKIVNADAMQAYKGLDVITNKMPVEDRKGVDHLLMDFKEAGEQYVVGQWVNDAMDAIDDMHGRKEIPIVVGGTSYWLQHLVFPNRLAAEPFGSHASVVPSPRSRELVEALSRLSLEHRELFNALPSSPPSAADEPASAFQLYSLLAALDPAISSRWHWRDTRKVLRSLILLKETGKKPSLIYQEQSQTAVAPRYRALFLWLYSDPIALNPRLEQRIDEMIKNGLLAEVVEMRTLASTRHDSHLSIADYTVGVYQSIGFKEFSGYLDDPTRAEDSYVAAVTGMKNSTRRYAKRQVSWIRNKLLPAIYAANTSALPSNEGPHAYLLDASDPEMWHTCVQTLATNISEAFLTCSDLPNPRSLSRVAESMLSVKDKPTSAEAVLQARKKFTCPVCSVDASRPVMLEEGLEWDAHEKTRAHRRLARRSKREMPSQTVWAHPELENASVGDIACDAAAGLPTPAGGLI
ncbi:tRNA isopentenyltransferase [Amylostereum chailletii]|nr:tRNA isopentenyltransferase [Amylostereum chailletii]